MPNLFKRPLSPPLSKLFDRPTQAKGGGVALRTLVIANGDSNTYGQGGSPSYPTQLQALLDASYTVTNLGQSGRRIADGVTYAPSEIYPLFELDYDRFIILNWLSTNDLFDGRPGATVYADYKAFCLSLLTAAQARGKAMYLAAFTAIPQSGVGAPGDVETQRQNFNTPARANKATFSDFMVDLGADSRIGDSGDETSGYYAGDSQHISVSGSGVVAELAKAAITAFIAAIPAPANVVAPAITGGTPYEGVQLSGSLGVWTGGPKALSRQWKGDAAAISGATASTYTLTATEVGKVITETVTASGAGGTTSATSAATATVLSEPAGNLFVAPREASGDSTSAERTGSTVTADNTAGIDGTMVADRIALVADGRFYKTVTPSLNGTVYKGAIWLRADAPLTIRGRIVVSNAASATAFTFNVTTSWQRFEVTAGGANAGTGILIFGLDTRVAAGGDGLAKTVYTDKWWLGPST